MNRNGKTIPASTKTFYKILIIRNIFHDEVVYLPKDKIEVFYDNIISPIR